MTPLPVLAATLLGLFASGNLPLRGVPLPIDPVAVKLIQQLGAPAFPAREEAERQLIAMGQKAVPALLVHRETTNDTEIRNRATACLKVLLWPPARTFNREETRQRIADYIAARNVGDLIAFCTEHKCTFGREDHDALYSFAKKLASDLPKENKDAPLPEFPFTRWGFERWLTGADLATWSSMGKSIVENRLRYPTGFKTSLVVAGEICDHEASSFSDSVIFSNSSLISQSADKSIIIANGDVVIQRVSRSIVICTGSVRDRTGTDDSTVFAGGKVGARSNVREAVHANENSTFPGRQYSVLREIEHGLNISLIKDKLTVVSTPRHESCKLRMLSPGDEIVSVNGDIARSAVELQRIHSRATVRLGYCYLVIQRMGDGTATYLVCAL